MVIMVCCLEESGECKLNSGDNLLYFNSGDRIENKIVINIRHLYMN